MSLETASMSPEGSFSANSAAMSLMRISLSRASSPALYVVFYKFPVVHTRETGEPAVGEDDDFFQ